MQESYLNLPPRNSQASHNCTVLTNVYEIRTERFLNKYFLYLPTTTISITHQLAKHFNQYKHQKNTPY
jgi:hypothetical protein